MTEEEAKVYGEKLTETLQKHYLKIGETILEECREAVTEAFELGVEVGAEKTIEAIETEE